jgi:hypothetical protein
MASQIIIPDESWNPLSGNKRVVNLVLYFIIFVKESTHLSVRLHLLRSSFSKFNPLNILSPPKSVILLSLRISVFKEVFRSKPFPM